MFILVVLCVITIHKSSALLCFNGTFTHRRYGDDPLQNRGLFSPSHRTMARTRCSLTILCSRDNENPMCFVRSWSARARHAWIVQRGCYQPVENDDLLTSLSVPTRAMTCKRERLQDAEYKVCLCQADWCNSASRVVPCIVHCLNNYFRYTKQYVHTLYTHMLRSFK